MSARTRTDAPPRGSRRERACPLPGTPSRESADPHVAGVGPIAMEARIAQPHSYPANRRVDLIDGVADLMTRRDAAEAQARLEAARWHDDGGRPSIAVHIAAGASR
jgi:hypothetical protein